MEISRLKRKVRDVLKKAHFKGVNDLIDISDGPVDGNVHVVIVSNKLEHMDPEEKQELIWRILQERLSPEEWGHISLVAGTSPEEIKAR